MTHVYRTSKGPVVGDILYSIETQPAFAREHGPGRYVVDEHASEPLPRSMFVARTWGS